ncbi:MAG: hypothetical protein EHM72_08985, partial [Calditrichaeota bacterium]
MCGHSSPSFVGIVIVFLSFSCSASLFSEETKYYFHHPENNFGSDLIFNPASLFLNGTFDILRNNGRPKNIYKIPYRTGVDNVIENLTHPVQNIEKYGWTNFVENEVFNTSLNPDKMQFLPNYTLHLIGNSMQYIKLAEWYQHHQYPYPYLLSLATTLGYQFMNEVIENWDYRGANVDPIADMLIFNPVGFLLFSTDWGKEFFSEQFPIYDWSGQPYYNPGNGFMENAGQQYSAKIQFRSASRTSFFIHWGVFAALGLSYRMKNDCSLSVSYGSISYHLNDHRDGAARIVTSLLKSGVGI